MADNPRELIRAAQSAEMQGDVDRAVECLKKAAEVYRQAGNAPRALQLLRHARRLDGSRVDIAEEVNRLEWMPETLLARPGLEDDEDSRLASELERSLEGEPLPELVRRQRLIEDALREAGMHAEGEAPRDGKAWVIETEAAEDLQRLEAQLARVAASVDAADIARAGGAGGSPVEAVKAAAIDVAAAGGAGASPAEAVQGAGDVAATGWPAQATQLFRDGDAPLSGTGLDEAQARSVSDPLPADAGPEAAPRRRREKRLIERGPTRADAALDAWCSFCCRPRSEVGDLVAGPTGSFICAGCLSESVSLLGDVTPAPPPVRSRPVEPPGAFMELVGQAEAQALLERALQTGARCVLAVGPEGSGKSVWFQQLQRQRRGVFVHLAELEQGPVPQPLLVEDVDRMDAASQATLADFLSRRLSQTVVLSARGLCPDARGPVLRNDSGVLPVPTTAALGLSVRGAVPVSLLEHVQVLLPLHAPTQAEFVEIARRRLSLREPAVSLSEDVLGAFAAEAVRSPRAGHELHALLNRVPAGTWGLEDSTRPAPPRKGRRKGGT
ncbi:ClpX C4-type zinc finger protein [Pyxidicoccus trucidator]|uniref:ClpX C4-type zinc finger protein n=1 Tax=Pyxidicoccus trucidator TaxID=2709662 RepID=UPI0013D990A7|nr:ClpX C4-type zinc finger protein [Pyxidicoccus trucidator]